MNYSIDKDGDRIVAWSSKRLAYQPRGWQVTYRDELRVALGSIQGGAGLLLAELASTSTEFFDIENVLLYNVGASVFTHLAERGVAIRRVASPAPPAELAGTSPTMASYRIGARPTWLDRAGVVASVHLGLPRLTSDTKAHDVWWATHGSGDSAVHISGEFGLALRVTTDARRRLNATSIVKPLLDGVIAALQTGPMPDREVVERVARMLGQPAIAVASRLSADGVLVAEHPVVKRHGPSGVQWDPVDDRCTTVVLEVVRGDVEGWQVEGTLHELDTPSVS